MTIEKVKPMTPTIAIIPMNLTPSRSYLIFIGFGNNIDRTIEPLAVLNPVLTTIPFRDPRTELHENTQTFEVSPKKLEFNLMITFLYF